MAGVTNAGLSLSNVQSNQAGGYTVLVTNAWGAVTSAVATLTVLVPPTITTQPFFSGIALDVTPQISDSDQITLHIHPSVSVVTSP